MFMTIELSEPTRVINLPIAHSIEMLLCLMSVSGSNVSGCVCVFLCACVCARVASECASPNLNAIQQSNSRGCCCHINYQRAKLVTSQLY